MPSTRNLPAKSESTSISGSALFTQIRNPKKRALLAAFSQCGRLVKACKLADVHWTSHYLWLKQDKAYASAFEAATQIAADSFESEIYRRGFEGYDRPVTYQREITDHFTDYSDTLAIFALKGLRPEKYRDNAPLSASSGPVQVNIRLDQSTVDPLKIKK